MWDSLEIVGDTRIDQDDPRVRIVGEYLHHGESIHLHKDIDAEVCAYCALRASRAVRVLDRMKAGDHAG